ncbi:hypothetical protein N2152v2_003389 [Parachlorella kessleri]
MASEAPATAKAPVSQFQDCISGLQRWVDGCNEGALRFKEFLPLTVAGDAVGYLRPGFAEELLRFPGVFEQRNGGLALNDSLATQQERTAAVAKVLESLRVEGLITGWRNELYPVVQSFHAEPVFLVERAAAAHFGIKAYGVHMNGYVTLPDGSQELWVARRSKSKPTWPGKLDHMVAGGQPHGLSCGENIVKECGEEAGIPADLAWKARAVGAVSYTSLKLGGLGRDVLFCYDLELPADFVPQPQDGEVDEFMRLPVHQVVSMIANTNEFKDNCNLVIVDFLMRHGYLTPDMPGYCGLLAGLRSGDCS